MEKSHNESLDISTGTSEKVSYTNLPWNLADHSWEDSNSSQQFADICIGVRCGLPRLSSQNIFIKDGSFSNSIWNNLSKYSLLIFETLMKPVKMCV